MKYLRLADKSKNDQKMIKFKFCPESQRLLEHLNLRFIVLSLNAWSIANDDWISTFGLRSIVSYIYIFIFRINQYLISLLIYKKPPIEEYKRYFINNYLNIYILDFAKFLRLSDLPTNTNLPNIEINKNRIFRPSIYTWVLRSEEWWICFQRKFHKPLDLNQNSGRKYPWGESEWACT